MKTTSRNNADLHQAMHWQMLDAAQLAADKTKRIKQIIDAAYAALTSYYDHLVEIQSDPDLSQSGRQSRTADASKRAMGVIVGLSKPALAELDGDVQRLDQALLRAAAGVADDASRTLLKIEARQLAAQIDPLLLEGQYLSLCESGDDLLTCEAIEQAPAIGKMLRDDILEKGKIIRAAKLHPDQAEALRQAREARSILAAAVDQARATLGAPLMTLADMAAITDKVIADGGAAAAA